MIILIVISVVILLYYSNNNYLFINADNIDNSNTLSSQLLYHGSCMSYNAFDNILPHNNSISHRIYTNNDYLVYYNNPLIDRDITIKDYLGIYTLFDSILSNINDQRYKILWINNEIKNDSLYHDYYLLHMYLIDYYMSPLNISILYMQTNSIKQSNSCYIYQPFGINNKIFDNTVDIPILDYKLYHDSNSLVHKCFKYVNTRKYQPGCMPRPDRIFQILLTGLGGSGTHSLSNLLRSMHLDVAHERLWPEGSVSWIYSVNEVLGRVPYPYYASMKGHVSLWSPRYERVIHVIRCPMKQISSMTSHSKGAPNFLFHFIKIMREVDHSTIFESRLNMLQANLPKCLEFNITCMHISSAIWLYWNQMVQSYADATFRVESISNILSDVCNHFVYVTRLTKQRGTVHKCHEYLNLPEQDKPAYVKNAFTHISLSLYLRNRSIEYSHNLTKWERMYSDSSPGHYKHANYRLSDLQTIDFPLAHAIESYAKALNYSTNIDTCV